MIDEELKTWYAPGEIVKVRHNELDNVPNMYIVEKVTRTITNKTDGSAETIFSGMRCRWFDKDGRLQEAIFSTKDLIHVTNE